MLSLRGLKNFFPSCFQNAFAQRRIKQEINRCEQEKGIFEGIQKKMVERFQEIFISVESELASIEQDLREEAETQASSPYYSVMQREG